MRYLKGTTHLGLVYRRDKQLQDSVIKPQNSTPELETSTTQIEPAARETPSGNPAENLLAEIPAENPLAEIQLTELSPAEVLLAELPPAESALM
jgi:hypothetical protein